MPLTLSELERKQQDLERRLNEFEEVRADTRSELDSLFSRFPQNQLTSTDDRHLHKRTGRLNVRPPRELTIGTPAAGLVQMTRGYHTIDTAGDASSDNLAGILGGRPGEIIWIQPENDARTIVVKHNDTSEGTDGNRIFLNTGSDLTLDGVEDVITLIYDPAVDSAKGGWRDYPPVTGGPFICYDYLADSLYTGTEGAVSSVVNSTFTFKTYSTVEGATDDGIANHGGAFSVFVCPGTYVEDLEIPDHSHEIHIQGAGRDSVVIGGNTATSHQVANTDLFLHDLTMSGPAAGYSLTSGGETNMEIHATNVIFRRRMAGDHAGSEFYDCIWEEGIQFEAGDTPDTVLIVGGILSGATGLDLTVATGGKNGWDVRGLRMNTQATLKLRQVSNSRFDIHFETDGGSLNDQVAFTNEASNGIVLDCLFAPFGNGGQAITVASGLTINNLQVRGVARYATGISNNATRWFDNDGIVIGAHIDVSYRQNGSGNRLEDDITGPSIEGDFRESKFTLTPTDVEIKTDGSSAANVVDAGTIQSGSVGISPGTQHTILNDAAHSDAVGDDAVTRGSIIIGNSTPKWDELLIGGSARLLQSDGSDPSWIAVSGDITIAAGGAVTVAATHSGSAHHTKYTDAEAITAVEGEATLVLAGDVTVAGSGKSLEVATLNLTDAGSAIDISSGAITVTQSHHLVDTEAAAATDDLDETSAEGNIGDFLYLQGASSSRNVTIRSGVGTNGRKFHLNGEQSKVLHVGRVMSFICTPNAEGGTKTWVEIEHGARNRENATTAPGVTDDVDLGYSIGSRWIDVTGDREYACLDNTDGAAVWKETTHPLTTRGDLIRRGASANERFAAVTAGAVVGGDGTDVVATVPDRTLLLLPQGGTPTTTSGCASPVVVEAATNDVDYWVLDFDTGTDEFAFWGPVILPDNYDGGDFKATFYWTAASGSGTVKWGIQMLARGNDEAIDTAFGDISLAATDTLLAAGDVHITTELTGITPGGTPADGDVMFIRVFRDVSADTLGVDARLMQVKLHYGLNALSDN